MKKFKPIIGWIKKNTKLIEGVGLLLLLMGWLFNTYSIEKLTDGRQKITSFLDKTYMDYHGIQITANVRYESALIRDTIRQPNLTYIDNDQVSYEKKWLSPEIRKRWFARLHNSYFLLNKIVSHLEEVLNSTEVGYSPSLDEAKKQIASVNDDIKFVLDGREYIPENPPIPELSKVSVQKAGYIEKSVNALPMYVFSAHNEIVSLIDKKRSAEMKLYYALFVTGTVFLVAAKLFEWHYELTSKK